MLLKKGMRGEEVKTLQMTLKLRGYDIGPAGADGVFGDSTEKAVKEFQRDHNLEADGIVGPATQSALHKDYSGNTDYGELLKVGSSGPQVAEMQRLLIKAGFSVGATGADGIFGSGTENAVKRFQESRGLAADGIIGPDTKNALKSNSGSSSKLLKVGARGPEVKELQRLLINTGYGVGSYGADGVFGAGTESAVKRFQAAKGLEVDGIVGPATWSALRGGTSSELLRLGSRGESVREAQNLLIKAGYSVGSYGADGVFGAGTENAVKRFQGAKGLSVDGIIGPATWSALRGGSVESGLLKLGSRGDAVRQLQELLIKAGYSVGSYGADGVFGAGTESAVKKFQAAKGLAVDGIVGPATWGALYGTGGTTHVSGGPGVLKFVRVAEAQEFHERIINSKGEGDNINPYGAWYGMNGVPWCAIFVSWCANQAGILGSVVPRYHYCEDAVNWYRSMGRYRTRQSGYIPKVGDVIFFYDASESAPFCHTGIVTGYENGEVITTEGNAGQAVRHNLRYSRNYWKIHGYGDNGGIKSEEKESDKIIKALRKLEKVSHEYIENIEPSLPAVTLFFNYLRFYRYHDFQWDLSLGFIPVDKRVNKFVDYIESKHSDIKSILIPYIRKDDTKRFDLYGSPIKLAHLAATTLGYTWSPVPDFWTGWGGDLATAMKDTKALAEKEKIGEDVAALKVVGAPNNGSSFSYEDIITDIDSIELAKKVDAHNIVDSIINYYKGINNKKRRNVICYEITRSENPSLEMLYNTINNQMTGIDGFKLEIPNVIVLLRDLAGYPSQKLVNYTTMAFAKFIFSKLK